MSIKIAYGVRFQAGTCFSISPLADFPGRQVVNQAKIELKTCIVLSHRERVICFNLKFMANENVIEISPSQKRARQRDRCIGKVGEGLNFRIFFQ